MAGCVAVTGMIFWTFTFLCIMILSFIVGGSDFGEAVKIFVTLLPDFAEVMFFVVAIALMHACLENSVLTGFIGIVWINYFEGQIENVNIVGLNGAVIDESKFKPKFHHELQVGMGFQYGLFNGNIDFGPQIGYGFIIEF